VRAAEWELFQKNPWLVAGAWAVAFFVAVGVGLIPYVGLPASIVLGGVLLAGIHVFFLRLSRGQVASVADVFAGFGPAIGPLILCGTVSWLLGWFGILLCVIPGIYLMLCWHLAPLLILDRNLEFWPAMEISRKVVTRNFWPVLGLAVVAFLLWIAGLLLCGIGVFVHGPDRDGRGGRGVPAALRDGAFGPGRAADGPRDAIPGPGDAALGPRRRRLRHKRRNPRDRPRDAARRRRPRPPRRVRGFAERAVEGTVLRFRRRLEGRHRAPEQRRRVARGLQGRGPRHPARGARLARGLGLRRGRPGETPARTSPWRSMRRCRSMVMG
jgi:hypothetical protein